MKRGFLNTEKAKNKLSAAAEVSSGNTRDNGKGKARAENPADSIQPCPPLIDLHSIPPSMKSLMKHTKNKNRFVFRQWPRNPNGKVILPSDIHGKEAGNQLDLWGATLYDFYFVRRIPSNVHGLTISTGSRLTKVMKEFGELEHAQNEINWATREADPKEIPAWDPAQAIVAHERRVHAGFGITTKVEKKRFTSPEGGSEADVQMLDVSEPSASPPVEPKDNVEASNDVASRANEPTSGRPTYPMEVDVRQPSSDIPVESPFHPSHYPPPWPLVPFESPCAPFPLQRGLPIHLFPRKLYVHDPWNLVHADLNTFREGKEAPWSSKSEHMRTYTLSLPPELQRMAEIASKAAAAAEDDALRILEAVLILPQETEGPTEQPAIRAILPTRPRKPTEVPEAHLYLSLKGRLGQGNHSLVYETELELPRDLFCDSTYCKTCLDEQIKVEVDKLKDSGEWERQLNEAAKTYSGPGKQDAGSSPSPSSSSVQVPPRYVGFVKVTLEHVPMETVGLVAGVGLGHNTPADTPVQQLARVSDPIINRYVEYQGLAIPIHVNIQWQNPSLPHTICKHQLEKKKPIPRTARFRVAAKLSLPGDAHLEREARNYLKFPAHFFQHWSGYNVIPPLLDPTPVGALVPQFFGYYKPDILSNSDDDAYSSPILLIEHCGNPIRINELTIDDRHECASLLFRFHAAGWLHESFAERNILMQTQHPTCSPFEERDACDVPHKYRPYSFRLIDFGRSVEYEHASRRAVEESMGRTLFGML